jgi:carbon monoxide dehydrogenase subunit G
MLLKGEVTIHAACKWVGDFLTDPNQIGLCFPGIEKIETVEEMKCYQGVIAAGLDSIIGAYA